MACDLTLGRAEGCKDQVGGLNAVYFINYNDSNLDITYDSIDTDVIATIGSVATDVTAYKYELKGTSSFEQTVNSSRDNGTTFFEQALTLSLKRLTKEDHKELKLLTYGRPHVIVEDNNGNLFLAGLEHGLDVTGGTVANGAAMGDFVGYTLNMTGMEKIPANFCIPATGTTVAEKLAALNVTVTVAS